MTMNRDRRGKKTLVVIVGPTGSGKTDLSMAVAGHFDSPILSADSRQLFRGLAIGSAQPSERQLKQIDHYFIATHDIKEHFTAGRYEKEALAILEKLFEENDVVVAAGGSGLYIDALCNGMDELPVPDAGLRRKLEERLGEEGLESLSEELKRLDPDYYGAVDRNNPKRVIRALEVCLQTGEPYSVQRKGAVKKRGFDIIKIGTEIPREILYDRINRRVDMMIEAGLEREARALYPYRHLNSLQTVGYREMFDYFDGAVTLGEAIELIKRNSRRYAKRQLTWFGKDAEIAWFDPSDTSAVIEYIESRICKKL